MKSFSSSSAHRPSRAAKDLRVSIDAELFDLIERHAKLGRTDKARIIDQALRHALIDRPRLDAIMDRADSVDAQIEAIATFIADATNRADEA